MLVLAVARAISKEKYSFVQVVYSMYVNINIHIMEFRF